MHARQNFEVRALTEGTPGRVESALLYSVTGGADAEVQAREVFTRASDHMLRNDQTEWFTPYWSEVTLLGPNGMFECTKRPAVPKEASA